MTTEGVPYCCRRCIGGLNGSLWPLCSPLPPHILIYTDSLLLEIQWKRLYLCAFPSHTDICDDWAILLYMFFKSRNTRSSTVHFRSHSRKYPNWGHRHFWCCVPCFIMKYWKPKSMLYGHTASSYPQSTTSSTRSKTSSASRASAFSRKSDHIEGTTS